MLRLRAVPTLACVVPRGIPFMSKRLVQYCRACVPFLPLSYVAAREAVLSSGRSMEYCLRAVRALSNVAVGRFTCLVDVELPDLGVGWSAIKPNHKAPRRGGVFPYIILAGVFSVSESKPI